MASDARILDAPIAERFLFVAGGAVTEKTDFRSLISDEGMRTYLGPEMSRTARAPV